MPVATSSRCRVPARRRAARAASVARTAAAAFLALCLAPGASFAAGTGPATGPDCSRPFTLGLHEHGLLFDAQVGTGIDKDIAEEMARRSGCHIQTTVLPRARIWQLIESGGLDFSLTGISTPQRETFAAFAWYVSNKYYLLVRRDARLRSVEEFGADPRLKLGVIRSYRFGERANRFVDRLEQEQRLVYANGLEPLFRVLLEDRVQGLIIEPFDYPALRDGELREKTTILEFDDPPVPHGLILSRRALPPAQLRAWSDVIESMRADGTMRRIFERYFPADLARTMTSF